MFADDRSLPAAWTPYFAAADADLAAARIRERGGTVAVGPLAFAAGRAVLAADPAGAVFGLWQGEVLEDWRVGHGPAPAWLELRTRDAFAAALFCGEALDWAGEAPGTCVAAYEHDHVVLRHGRDTVARISGGAVDEAPDPHHRPRWHVPFQVTDLEAATSAGSVGPVQLHALLRHGPHHEAVLPGHPGHPGERKRLKVVALGEALLAAVVRLPSVTPSNRTGAPLPRRPRAPRRGRRRWRTGPGTAGQRR
ncbi:hypothetical protein ACFWP3_36555 [Streptomyces sp. NPDC058525]|uniref:hypothetical protein n=1 Tax=unclassified Streptomyces TaxID=2593676 RepID=UPI003666FF1A